MPEHPTVASGQAGQVVPFLAGVVLLIALCALGIAGVARQAVDRARAQNAADAAALAAALRLDPADAHTVAVHLAERNGARLVTLRRVGSVVVATVTVAGHEATAAARPVAGPDPVNP